ncbi:hypothetical protein GQ53DRAFT_748926 [Thozetella sp. PMI_491]|nr:hypothetical protein GQ53DRAFT_748926 [Thozetella sp. PMI_491]
MPRIPTGELARYLLHGNLGRNGCLRLQRTSSWAKKTPTPKLLVRCQHSSAAPPQDATASTPIVPFRKQLRDQAKQAKESGKKKKKNNADNQTVPGWELTVGIEIHAQLNTRRKLFSPATTSFNDTPNSHVALFDLAMPGSQPVFQPATLIPAVRAALALNCDIQRVSRFDRKHYFHWDQPSGYQITQYYEPFARDGQITLRPRDGIAPQDGESIRVGIKQVQMEQDTAKTTAQPGGMHWLDFNRVGVPLVEIITLPEIHHPATAAALVRKIQLLLKAVDACVSGMEAGGLRADVNVSVRRSDDPSAPLGTRTEIKNLSSFKAVEDAIIAERDRQITLLGSGGVVEGETRGWSLGSTETRRLRGKEGEVDYRYMPDPDLGPVIIDDALVRHLEGTMGVLPDAEADELVQSYGMSARDAMALMQQDGGARIEYFYKVLGQLRALIESDTASAGAVDAAGTPELLAANWCLHELGKLAETSSDLEMTPDGECRVPSSDLAEILFHLHQRRITGRIAKELLWVIFRGDLDGKAVSEFLEDEGLWFRELSDEEYLEIADEALEGEEKVLGDFRHVKEGKKKAYPEGKLMFLVGKMMRAGPEERMDPKSAARVMRQRLEEVV